MSLVRSCAALSSRRPAAGACFSARVVPVRRRARHRGDWIAIIVLIVVPVVVIVVFWIVHVLPEKIAEKRHHPQKDAIHTLCLLSLVFGGLLWPLAWLWAYTRPVAYRMAYGTDKHEDYFVEMGDEAKAGDGSLDARDRCTCATSSTRWRRAAACRPRLRDAARRARRAALRRAAERHAARRRA